MRTITFNKHVTLCMGCRKNSVKRWNQRCSDCKKNNIEKPSKIAVVLGKSQPAAILTDKNGNEIYVDKFGNKTENPGYDMQRDPRGWKYSGKQKKSKSIVI